MLNIFIVCIFPFGDGISNWMILCMLQILQPYILHAKVIYTYNTESSLPKGLVN